MKKIETPELLDRIADKVLAYPAKAKTKAQKKRKRQRDKNKGNL